MANPDSLVLFLSIMGGSGEPLLGGNSGDPLPHVLEAVLQQVSKKKPALVGSYVTRDFGLAANSFWPPSGCENWRSSGNFLII